jgi:tetratricopeptide (TPR) repeat protein
MAAGRWLSFPDPQGRYRHEGAALRKAWPRLHRGDREPWPAGPLAPARQDAWRAFHAGRFQQAVEAATALGAAGAAAANKAAGVHATYLVKDGAVAMRILLEAIARGERAVAELPQEANSHYFLAFVLGRYSQRISVVKALAEGLGSRIQHALERTLQLEPRHAEAHVALGVFHAELVDKLGPLASRLTYGASRDAALRHFDTALELAPASPVARLEYARALRLLAPRETARARELLGSAAAIDPADAMEALDVAAAKAALLEA